MNKENLDQENLKNIRYDFDKQDLNMIYSKDDPIDDIDVQVYLPQSYIENYQGKPPIRAIIFDQVTGVIKKVRTAYYYGLGEGYTSNAYNVLGEPQYEIDNPKYKEALKARELALKAVENFDISPIINGFSHLDKRIKEDISFFEEQRGKFSKFISNKIGKTIQY